MQDGHNQYRVYLDINRHAISLVQLTQKKWDCLV